MGTNREISSSLIWYTTAKLKQADYERLWIPFWKLRPSERWSYKELTKVIKEINPDIVISMDIRNISLEELRHLEPRFQSSFKWSIIPTLCHPLLFTIVRSSFLPTESSAFPAVKEHLLNLFFFNKHKMHVIYNGFYIDRFFNETPLTSRLPGVLMIARFSSQKDHITLIKAAKIMKDKKKSCPIYFIGDGSRKHFDKSQKLVEKLGLEDTVHFLGRREDVPELLAKYQISVLSTHYEGLSGVIMEAMAAGNVVIATNAPGVTELITHEKTGFLVPPKSPEILADRIISVLEHPEKYTQIVESAQKYILENFNVDIMVKNYEQVFREEYSKYINKK